MPTVTGLLAPSSRISVFNTWLDFALEPFTSEQLVHWVKRWLSGVRKSDENAIQDIVRESSQGHPFIANFVLGLCIDQSLAGHKPDPVIIEKKLRETEGPGPILVHRILAELVPFEREMLRSLSEDQQVAPAKVRALRRLANYGLLPPGTTIPEEATE